ncbi:alginate lyase precursor [Shewanella intestini]|uniref:Alginate lyase n=2 Tax=Shewanellaceae TaxID=267890 RepID=A0ABS5I1M5_9GAMM|nr:alginate lyase precursor [Shewanella intestini]MRG36518.1 alginate lyase precursor [Shewanella sp. XMDDZSB0408]
MVPISPANPIAPDIPVVPIVPAEPTEPDIPVVPIVPAEPTEPDIPVVPIVPAEPTEPDIPVVPIVPAEPTEPSEPDTPDTPEGALPPITEDLDFTATGIPLGVTTIATTNCSEVFDSISSLEKAVSTEMPAGTTLCLADGEYTDGLELKFGGQGTADNPIKIAAENAGQAKIVAGKVSISMAGDFVQLQGMVFNGVSYDSSLIQTRHGTHNLCRDCRISEVAIIDAVANNTSGILMHLYGQRNWVDHSILSGKTVKNPMISFNRWVDSSWDEDVKLAELARDIVIYKNYIANRAPADDKLYAGSSDNDYEAIRTGLSDTHHYDGNSFIIGNLFEQIQGEAEVISNKGSNNVISHNTIRNSHGSLTNRHGHSAKIEHNFILGDGHPFSGGIRLVDDSHTVTNNYIDGARYLNTTHHGGIVILGSDGAGDANNGYQQVENVHVAHNTIVDSVNSFNFDGGDKQHQPTNIYLANNLVDHAIGPVFKATDRGVPTASNIAGNIVYGQAFSSNESIAQGQTGFDFIDAGLVKHAEDGLYRPTEQSPNLDGELNYEKGDFAAVTLDMDGQQRLEITAVGADEVTDEMRTFKPLTYADVGPLSYHLEKPQPIVLETEIVNASFDDGLQHWLHSDAQVTTPAQAFSRQSSAQVNSAQGYVTQKVSLLAQHDYMLSAFVKGAYRLEVEGIEHQQSLLDDSQYQWVSMPFNSGDATEANIVLSQPDSVTLKANLIDANLGEFRTASGKSDVWKTYEDDSAGLGDVGSSGDSAFTDTGSEKSGSARVRFKKTGTNHDFTSLPGLSQVVSGLPLHTDMSYSLYYCDNKGENSLSSLHFGAREVDGTPIVDSYAHVKDLGDAPQGNVKSCFKQVTTQFNTGESASIEVFAVMEINKDGQLTDDDIYAHSQFTSNELEVRLDEFSLTYEGEPEAGMVGYFDEVRLVTRSDQDAE